MKKKTGKESDYESLANFSFCFLSLYLSPLPTYSQHALNSAGIIASPGRSTSRSAARRRSAYKNPGWVGATVRYEFLIMHACASARNHAL